MPQILQLKYTESSEDSFLVTWFLTLQNVSVLCEKKRSVVFFVQKLCHAAWWPHWDAFFVGVASTDFWTVSSIPYDYLLCCFEY